MVKPMNITNADKEILKAVKTLVEKIESTGKLPNDIEGVTELYQVWNKTYKKNERVNNCPSCRQTKFMQLKRTYDLFELKNHFKKQSVKKKSTL